MIPSPAARIRPRGLAFLCMLAAIGPHLTGLQGTIRAQINSTPTWQEAVDRFSRLASEHPDRTGWMEFGTSDVGRPLHLFTMGDPEAELRILVNNAIHPGEPCGVNASIDWAESLLEDGSGLPEGVLIGIVPMYNVGGGLRRNCCTRANQVGPEEYGFRGNARNLDLNRDFIKCDSRNALAFNRMFTDFSPDIFVDTHTSNGADYQPVLTLITTQPDKLGGPLGAWLEGTFEPQLYAGMSEAGVHMVPYVNSIGATPDEGITDFLETPRYSTGYAALHHTIGFTTEAHMLKPFHERVEATRQFLEVLLASALGHSEVIRQLRKEQAEAYRTLKHAPVAWAIDTGQVDTFDFPGYEARYEWSSITGERRLVYDRNAPFTRPIRRMHTCRVERSTPVPAAFIVPQAWRHVIERLEANGVLHHPVDRDTVLTVEVCDILGHSSASRPYEGHHYRTIGEVERRMEDVALFEGDLIIPVDQPAARYLLETLGPEGVDGFLAWNFFDSALQQKEYFSAYVFEETAAEMLAEDPELKAGFEAARAAAGQEGEGWSARQQLDWLYKRSPHFEGTSSRYPILAIPMGSPIPFLP